MSNTTFGEAVRRVRAARGFTQTELAARAGPLALPHRARSLRPTRMRMHTLAGAFGFTYGAEVIAAADKLGPDIVTRPSACAVCSAPIVQPARVGRPLTLCGALGTKSAMAKAWRARHAEQMRGRNLARRIVQPELRCRVCDRRFTPKRRDLLLQ